MNAENLALCRLYRKPVGDKLPLAYADIAKLVKKKDGTRPTRQAVYYAVQDFNQAPAKRGRKAGWRKTSKTKDVCMPKTFKRLRRDGHGVDS